MVRSLARFFLSDLGALRSFLMTDCSVFSGEVTRSADALDAS
jgi:hypothetical protein